MGDQVVSLSSPALAQGLIMSTFYPLIEILIAHTILYNSLIQIWPSQSIQYNTYFTTCNFTSKIN